MDEEDIRQAMHHEYLQGLLDEQEEQMQNYEREETKILGEEALQQSSEEERLFARMDEERERKEQEWEAMMDPYFDCRFPEDDYDIMEYRAMKAYIK